MHSFSAIVTRRHWCDEGNKKREGKENMAMGATKKEGYIESDAGK